MTLLIAFARATGVATLSSKFKLLTEYHLTLSGALGKKLAEREKQLDTTIDCSSLTSGNASVTWLS